ncbi:MAG TPA: SDR family oxidoreductase [Gammaproteobacteria bacterium]|nr:SDR family oxidoreductase [Gammaproteobacteria bacterium]
MAPVVKDRTGISLCERELAAAPRVWLITGVAGFIGSNLLQRLLSIDQKVVGLDNFSTGNRANLEAVRAAVTSEQWGRFKFLEGDIRDIAVCRPAVEGADYVLHQAALGSVPRSVSDPLATHEHNINGFLNILVAARDAHVARFVYASSSSVYGDHPDLPKVEERTGDPLSPYAVTKKVNELYASVFHRCYGLDVIGLRYFNIFGPRQDPNGAYAAVIPLWFKALLNRDPVFINGDGETSRDFCYVDNAVQANMLAAWTPDREAVGQVYNIAVGERTTLLQLYELIRREVAEHFPAAKDAEPQFRDFRQGDIRHSLADISKARKLLGYKPAHTVGAGLTLAANYYIGSLSVTV